MLSTHCIQLLFAGARLGIIERAKECQCIRRNLTALIFVQFVELASGVRQTSNFNDATLEERLVELGSRALEGVREFLVFGGEQFAPQSLLEDSSGTAGNAAESSIRAIIIPSPEFTFSAFTQSLADR